MADTIPTDPLWLRREALKTELEMARRALSEATADLRFSTNPAARAKAFIRNRPATAALTTLLTGVIAARLVPLMLWRGKASIFARFANHLARGAAGLMLPVLVNRFLGKRRVIDVPMLSHP